MVTAEVTIRGAGIFGLSIAWVCVQRGARVQVIDPYGPGVGASGGVVGALAPHVPENWNPKKQFQLESLLMAEDFWAEVAQQGGGEPGYARSGRIQPIADAQALNLAEERRHGAVRLWQGLAIWELRPAGSSGWKLAHGSRDEIFDTLSARIHPRSACDALAKALNTRGVHVQSQGTDRGSVIHASGVAGLEALGQGRSRSVGAGIKGQAALLDFAVPNVPQLFIDGLHIIPHADGTTAIGSTTERDYDSAQSTDKQLDILIEKARDYVPALRGRPVLQRWAGLRPRSRSRAPMLGPWPGRPGHFIANGGFKIGFGMAPKVAQVMADLVLDGHNMIPSGFEVEASL